ncbi:MAG: hypothetical protein HOV80_22730, partial [Polyangiaceae bacterium]|nr:hypothetical protein [Polyangiaceae bacterium]
MGARTKLGAALAALVLIGCSSEIAPPASPAGGTSAKSKPAKNGAEFGLPRTWPKAILMPDLDPAKKSDLDSDRGNLRLWGRMRVLVRPDGSMERAPDLLPIGRVSSIRLPARLGGGFVFVSATGRGTELWRAPSWLDPLVPLLSVGPAADMDRPLVAGFDRLYVRLRSGELLAFDPKNGAAVGLGPLPVAPSHGEMVFIDGWRAVVEADLRGPLATFDAGATWRSIPIGSKLRSLTTSEKDPDDGVSALLGVDGGYYVLSGKGDLAYFRGPTPGVGGAAPPMSFATPPPGVRRTPQVLPPIEEDTAREKPGPLGRRPLRVALERGYPDTDKTAVVAQAGALVRVSLETGAILEHHEAAYPDPYASCHAIALASGKTAAKGAPDPNIGFVCGIPDGATTIYALERPAKESPRLVPVMKFAKPRAVLESGQGAIVVRGTCSDDEPPAGVRPFCVRFVDGSTREVRVRGEVGSERVIALADGRVAILVPPRAGTQGQLSLLEGSRSKHVPLRVPDGAPREVETGLWADGMQEVAPGELGGWVEAGGPT